MQYEFFMVVVHVIHRFFELFAAKIKAGKVASIGIIFETDINRIGTTINRCFQAGKFRPDREVP